MSAIPSLRAALPGLAERALTRGEISQRCALCADAETRALFQVDGALIVACRGCGLVRQDTRPLATAALYDGGYYATDDPKGGYANYFLDADVNKRTFGQRIREVEKRYGRKGRLLDVGCALGDFLLQAEAAGWDVAGVRISTFAAQRARERGLTVSAGRLDELGLPQASFDVITLYDANEHMSDPIATLAPVPRLLVPRRPV